MWLDVWMHGWHRIDEMADPKVLKELGGTGHLDDADDILSAAKGLDDVDVPKGRDGTGGEVFVEGSKGFNGEEYYKKGLQEIPDDWIEVEAPEELKIKSESFKSFLREQGYNPNNWRKVVEKWASPDGTIYQRNYWTNGTDVFYHGEGIEEFFPH